VADMRLKALMLCIVSLAGVAGCKSKVDPAQEAAYAALPMPTKEILIFEGDTSRAYEPLGEVDVILPHGVAYGSTLDVPPDAQKELKDLLKRVAFSKYGARVDAIVSVKMTKQIEGGLFGTMGAGFGAKNSKVGASGVAVAFK
jgi:hypothetical protein